MKLAIIGATGLVGQTILKVLDEYKFEYSELILVASNKSVGKEVVHRNKVHQLITIDDALNKKPNICIFSAGKEISLSYAKKFAEQNCFVVDNSSAWRGDENIKLIVPEVNINTLTVADKIIANPNCSTIQLVVALAPLHNKYKLRRVIISTYQSVSGSGYKGINQLEAETLGNITDSKAYPHQIFKNCIPQGGDFLENNYSEEEMKLVNETRKILNINDLKLTSTVVRVPVTGGHSESVNIEFENEFSLNNITSLLSNSDGICIVDDPQKSEYPMPLDTEGKNLVYVGRIRRDFSAENAINLWIVADNLRKGAATNAVQIAIFIKSKLLKNA